MDLGILSLVLGVGAFVGTHLLLSHPLRAGLVRRFGAQGFLGIYSLVALVTFVWAVVAFDRVPSAPQLWDGQALVPWLLACLLTLVAAALFLASLMGNPALAGTDVSGLSTRLPKGVFKITRHPMMSAFALWGIAHILIAPSARTIILAGGVTALAVIGSRGQDAKKLALYGREWRVWMQRTSFWPKPSALGSLGMFWVGAVPAWLLLTWLHANIGQVPAGIWLWLEL
ncbi:MAG: NnrU family protein [Novosphingobium sp.]